MSVNKGAVPASSGVDADVAKLHELGYAQELHRRMGGFSNFAVSFTIISVLSGCLTLFYFGMQEGGPVDIVWGWIIVGFFTIVVGLGMAEIASSYPTAGGLYYWSAKLAKGNPGAWSWFTGWFNLLGQVAVTAGIDYGFAFFFSAFLNMVFNFPTTSGWILVVYAGILIIHGLLNTFGVRVVAFLSDVSAWWHILGVAVIAGVLVFVPSHHASASFVFTKFINLSGFGSKWYVFLIGFLMAQYTFTGYDASAHMSEETKNPDLAAPRGIVSSIVVSLIAGWILILAISFGNPDEHGRVLQVRRAGIRPGAHMVRRHRAPRCRAAARHRLHGSGLLRHGLGHGELADAVRLQPGRGRAGHKMWHRINPRTRTPTNWIWFCVVFAFILAVPSLWSGVAYAP